MCATSVTALSLSVFLLLQASLHHPLPLPLPFLRHMYDSLTLFLILTHCSPLLFHHSHSLYSPLTLFPLSTRFRLDKDQVTYGLPTADVRGTVLGDQCPVEVDFPCQPRKYRAFNGYCNNVQNPKWGNAITRYLRFLPANYGDGVSIPRQRNDGQYLPSARVVSLTIHRDHDTPHKYMTAIAAVYGQFLAHDLAHTPQMAGLHSHTLC